jgi:hypothetical protein
MIASDDFQIDASVRIKTRPFAIFGLLTTFVATSHRLHDQGQIWQSDKRSYGSVYIIALADSGTEFTTFRFIGDTLSKATKGNFWSAVF